MLLIFDIALCIKQLKTVITARARPILVNARTQLLSCRRTCSLSDPLLGTLSPLNLDTPVLAFDTQGQAAFLLSESMQLREWRPQSSRTLSKINLQSQLINLFYFDNKIYFLCRRHLHVFQLASSSLLSIRLSRVSLCTLKVRLWDGSSSQESSDATAECLNMDKTQIEITGESFTWNIDNEGTIRIYQRLSSKLYAVTKEGVVKIKVLSSSLPNFALAERTVDVHGLQLILAFGGQMGVLKAESLQVQFVGRERMLRGQVIEGAEFGLVWIDAGLLITNLLDKTYLIEQGAQSCQTVTKNGICQLGILLCARSFMPPLCQQPLCSNSVCLYELDRLGAFRCSHCSGRGSCDQGVCKCQSQRTGSFCQIRTISCRNPEQSQVAVPINRCKCKQKMNQGGKNCKINFCPNNCNRQGQCLNGLCKCQSYAAGPDCSVTRIDIN